MFNTSIITIAYDKDLNFLKYNLKSIKKFCKGYIENIVVIDDHEDDCKKTQEYLESIGQKYYINLEAKFIKHGYIRQQYIKFFSDKYVSEKSDFICHVDCDNIFTSQNDPSIFFYNQKPILGIQEWEKMENNHFKPYVDSALEYESNYNFMRRMPLVYQPILFKMLRSYLEEKKGDLIEYLNSVTTISEYNLLGAYAYKFNRDFFHWVDVNKDREEWANFNKSFPCTQYSNRPEAQPRRYVDLSVKNNVISKILD
jgi:hypothetical protein